MLTQTEQRTTTSAAAEENQGSLSAYRYLRAQLNKRKKDSPSEVAPTRAAFMRRFAAVSVYDYIICLWVATISVVAVRVLLGDLGQRLTAHAPIQLYTLIVFLFRDCLFSGRGFGKGLLGLTVVDRETKQAATMAQSLTRNFVFLWPYFLYQLIALVLPKDLNHNVLAALMTFGTTYVVLVLVAESILMLRGEGVRLADRISGTLVVSCKPCNASEQC